MPAISTMIAKLFDDADADARRVNREIDAIRTRFESQPQWPSSGVRCERG